VHDKKNGSLTRSIPTSVPSAVSKSQSNCRCDNNNDNKLGLIGRAQAETNLGVDKFTCKNDVVGDAHFCSSFMNDLTLPKFSACKRQHIVNFLEELVIFN
jgi:hypothetical protein